MAASFAYLLSVKNLASILAKIKAAGTPPKFTNEFLKANLGFASSSDRAVIGVLKALGFVTPDGTPTARYNEFRDDSRSGQAMATGLREGWADIFLSNQRAYELTTTQLTELFKSVTGAGEAVAQKMATTFKSLSTAADWTHPKEVSHPRESQELKSPIEATDSTDTPNARPSPTIQLRHDVHVHLPATSDVAVYTAIFRALRDELLD